MATKVYFDTAPLAITGGEDIFTCKLRGDFERNYFSVVFYSDEEMTIKTTPTQGSVLFSVWDENLEFGVEDGEFLAELVYSPSTVQPACVGHFDTATIKFDGVDSGLYAKAWVIQSGWDHQ